jgi:hypothetical protein
MAGTAFMVVVLARRQLTSPTARALRAHAERLKHR